MSENQLVCKQRIKLQETQVLQVLSGCDPDPCHGTLTVKPDLLGPRHTRVDFIQISETLRGSCCVMEHTFDTRQSDSVSVEIIMFIIIRGKTRM